MRQPTIIWGFDHGSVRPIEGLRGLRMVFGTAAWIRGQFIAIDKMLRPVEQAILSRVVLHEYTHAETAEMLGVSVRAISYKYKQARDSLTELLLRSELLILPPS